jgi:hypothetical protein
MGKWKAAVYGARTIVVVGTGSVGYQAVTEDPNKPHFITSKGPEDQGGGWEEYQWTAGLPVDGSVEGVAYGNGIFVAVGTRHYAGNTTMLPCAWVSLDGYRWNEPIPIPNELGGHEWSGTDQQATAWKIVWVSSISKFVAFIGDNNLTGTAYFATSSDGATWTTVEVTGVNRGPAAIGYGGLATDGTNIVFLDFGGSPWTSTDGSTWTHRPQGNNPGMPVYYLGYGGGKFLWPGDGTFHEYYSTDNGVTWQIGVGALLSVPYSCIVYDGTHFHLGGSETDLYDTWLKVAISTTGLSWTETLVNTAGGQGQVPAAFIYNGQ